jgi:hypothetical protein
MLIKKRDLDGIANGEITLAFRRWKRPTVKAGGTLRTPIGVLRIETVDAVSGSDITEVEARMAGYDSLASLHSQLHKRNEGQVYRIALHLSGPDPRDELRQRAALTTDEVEELARRLDRFDSRSARGPWTRTVLEIISENPGTRAADLAAMIQVEKVWLKPNVRKLKELGLTESLSPGYRLSPRGRAFWRKVKE